MDSKDNFRRLTTPREIAHYLKISKDQKEPVTIYFPERKEGFRSFFVGVDTEHLEIELDSMVPTLGDRFIRANETFDVIGSVSGVQLRFNNNTLDKLNEDADGNPGYCIPFPNEMRYMQRRDAFRAQIQHSIRIKTVLIHEEFPHKISGFLSDLSATGCRVVLRQAELQEMQVASGISFNSLRFQIPGGIEIDTIATVRNVLIHEEIEEVQIGLEFTDLSGINERHIDRFVNQLQRDARRDR
ncbi:flagellar brake protein [Aestuariirhabdus sp. Z084]|uniref:flagellar brake protein n=1 Tax=Aestuariirhabdus haliotis TaxID=2918751 RepID=UPI00201B40BF|nr:flagellar brake protein [Aestuariirhabdus haliotis]MCL6414434.1 flagellar brake protein [Aestuariirhabdus haliotis]MCL6418584.1 flagellar brake protein [Aestuariirhabdus haliotis]